MTEDYMVGWHHQLDGHEFEQVLGVGDGQGSLACCSPWGLKESDTTEQLNWTELNILFILKQNSIKFLKVCPTLILFFLSKTKIMNKHFKVLYLQDDLLSCHYCT